MAFQGLADNPHAPATDGAQDSFGIGISLNERVGSFELAWQMGVGTPEEWNGIALCQALRRAIIVDPRRIEVAVLNGIEQIKMLQETMP